MTLRFGAVLLVCVLSPCSAVAQEVGVQGVGDDEVRERVDEVDAAFDSGFLEFGVGLSQELIPLLRSELHRDYVRVNLAIAYSMLRRCAEASSVARGIAERRAGEPRAALWASAVRAAHRCVPPPRLGIEAPIALALGGALATLSVGLRLGAEEAGSTRTRDGPLAWSVGLGVSAAVLLAVGLGAVVVFELE